MSNHHYIAEIEHRICGIPCLIGVKHYERVKGSYCYNAPSSDDYYGYTEAEFDVLDRRGRLAPWLQRKLTSAAEDLIYDVINEHMENDYAY